MLKWLLIYFAQALRTDTPILESLFSTFPSEPIECIFREFELVESNPCTTLPARLELGNWIIGTHTSDELSASSKSGHQSIRCTPMTISITVQIDDQKSMAFSLYTYPQSASTRPTQLSTYSVTKDMRSGGWCWRWSRDLRIPRHQITASIRHCIEFINTHPVENGWIGFEFRIE